MPLGRYASAGPRPPPAGRNEGPSGPRRLPDRGLRSLPADVSPDRPATAVHFQRVSRQFGDVRAVDDVDLEIRAGEFFAMLGPSGSGKTTCLRLIAGFDRPTSGHIEIHGLSADGVPPYDRDVNTVFQDYALFPHMSVRDNVAYGLMVRGVTRRERYARDEQMLALVKLEGLGARKPAALSGGQRQRVALARALINEPAVLLLDEPLGALDLKLRRQMQLELKALQRTLGITFVFVTHDQEEALSLSDRLVVFDHGRIEQIGTPEEIYERPVSRFVAGFVGSSNILESPDMIAVGGGGGAFSIRPERIDLLDDNAMPDKPPDAELLSFTGTVHDLQYQGGNTRVAVTLDNGVEMVVEQPSRRQSGCRVGPGQRVRLAWMRADMQPLRG